MPRFLLKNDPFPLLAEDEEDGAAEAEPGPDEVEAEAFLHVEHGERHEDGERDDFLDDLELGERERAVADAVRGHLEQVFEQRDAPADDGNPPQNRVFAPFCPICLAESHNSRVICCHRPTKKRYDTWSAHKNEERLFCRAS